MNRQLEATLAGWIGCRSFHKIIDTDQMGADWPVGALMLGKSRFVTLVVTENGDVFGNFVNATVVELLKDIQDETAFLFSFQTRGQAKTPQRWFAQRGNAESDNAICFYKNSDPNNDCLYDVGSVSLGFLSVGAKYSDQNTCSTLSGFYEDMKNNDLCGGQDGESIDFLTDRFCVFLCVD